MLFRSDPELLRRAAEKYGSRRVVLSMDVRRVGDVYRVFAEGGQTDTGRDALEWARLGEELGAGEIVLNSIDTDGVRGGFDLPMLEAVGRVVSVPIVASGGAGTMQDFAETLLNLDGSIINHDVRNLTWIDHLIHDPRNDGRCSEILQSMQHAGTN